MAQIKIDYYYKYYLKNSRKELSKNQYFYRKSTIKKLNNKPVMFVRAPKHFKSGKQFLVFFNGFYIKQIKLELPKIFFFYNKNLIYKSLSAYKELLETNEILLYKIIITTTIKIKI